MSFAPDLLKDRVILEYNPHQLIEGMIIGGWAMQCAMGYVYIRGEFLWLIEKLEAAIQQAATTPASSAFSGSMCSSTAMSRAWCRRTVAPTR